MDEPGPDPRKKIVSDPDAVNVIVMAWWGWLIVAWLAADCVFVIAWTRRVRLRDPDDLDAIREVALADDDEGEEEGEHVGALTPPPAARDRRAR